MKLKKLLKKYVGCKTKLIIRVSNGIDDTKVISAYLSQVFDTYTDLLNCKVLQLEAVAGALVIFVSEAEKQECKTFADLLKESNEV